MRHRAYKLCKAAITALQSQITMIPKNAVMSIMRLPCELLDARWEDHQTPIDQTQVEKYRSLLEIYGDSDTDPIVVEITADKQILVKNGRHRVLANKMVSGYVLAIVYVVRSNVNGACNDQ